jgi:hypothetical protein
VTASLKESVQPPAEDLHPQGVPGPYWKRDEDFVRLLNSAGLACELDAAQLAVITSSLEESRIDCRRMDILGLYYRGKDDASVASRRRRSDRFFMHNDYFSVNAHQLVASLANLNPEIAPVKLQRIGDGEGPLVLRTGEHFSAVLDAEKGTVAVRALIRSLNALLAKARVPERLVPLVPDESRELYVGVTEEGAMTLLQGGCTEISAVAALREFASW